MGGRQGFSQRRDHGSDAIPVGTGDQGRQATSKEMATPARRSAALPMAFSDFGPPETPNGICYSSNRN